MKLKVICLLAAVILMPTQLHSIGNLSVVQNTLLFIQPVSINLSNIETGNGFTSRVFDKNELRLASFDPKGIRYPIEDINGNASWIFNDGILPDSIDIIPDPKNYAGPVEVLLNGKVIDRFRPQIPGSSDLVLDKTISRTMPDGMVLNVHYTDYSLERASDRHFPEKILNLMKKSYQILTEELKFNEHTAYSVMQIDTYMGDDSENGLLPFSGFYDKDFKRAPLFVIKEDKQSHKKCRTILMPVDYTQFLGFWNQINKVPFRVASNPYRDLAGSVAHEMTHAVIHAYNENLGSTEHSVRSGDWYTEGPARYFETKIGSYSGFASQGFRKTLDDKIQFSRGGANYYLRYPDESFFSLRYEASLFWMYYEHKYGLEKIIEITKKLAKIKYEAQAGRYLEVLEKVTRESAEEIFDEFFNWIYEAKYKEYPESRFLLPVAKTRSVWSSDRFRLFSASGKEICRLRSLNMDWISEWGEDSANSANDIIAGDWDQIAGIQPLAFDVHEILIGDPDNLSSITIENEGPSGSLIASIYLYHNGEVDVTKRFINKKTTLDLSEIVDGQIVKIGVVLSNMDYENSSRYSIHLK